MPLLNASRIRLESVPGLTGRSHGVPEALIGELCSNLVGRASRVGGFPDRAPWLLSKILKDF